MKIFGFEIHRVGTWAAQSEMIDAAQDRSTTDRLARAKAEAQVSALSEVLVIIAREEHGPRILQEMLNKIAQESVRNLRARMEMSGVGREIVLEIDYRAQVGMIVSHLTYDEILRPEIAKMKPSLRPRTPLPESKDLPR